MLPVGLPFSEKKIIPRNTKQNGTDGSPVKIPPVLQKRKTSEFCSEPFLGREKPLEFHSEPFLGREKPSNSIILNHFSEEKNPRNSVPNHVWLRKTSEFSSAMFFGEKKPRNSVPNHFWKRKKCGIPFRIIFRREQSWEKDHLLAASLNFIISWNSVPFRFILSYGMDPSEILGITWNEHFIP